MRYNNRCQIIRREQQEEREGFQIRSQGKYAGFHKVDIFIIHVIMERGET